MKCRSLAEGSRGIKGISHRRTARGTTTPPVITVALRGKWIGTAQDQFLPMEKPPVWAN